MSDTERTFEAIKNILLDPNVKKTERDRSNLQQLLKSVEFRIKSRIAANLVNIKIDESMKVLDEYIAATEDKIKELEEKPYGIDKSVPELLESGVEYEQAHQRRQVAAYKEVLEFLQAMKKTCEDAKKDGKSSSDVAMEWFQNAFGNEFRDDELFRTALVNSLSFGYYELYPFGGEFVGSKMSPNQGGHYTTTHKNDERFINFDYVDKVAPILLDPNRVEKYQQYFGKKRRIGGLKQDVKEDKEDLVILDWYEAHKDEIAFIVDEVNAVDEEIFECEKQIIKLDKMNDFTYSELSRYRKNSLSALFHKKDIERAEAKLKETYKQLTEMQNKQKELKEQKAELMKQSKTLLGALENSVAPRNKLFVNLKRELYRIFAYEPNRDYQLIPWKPALNGINDLMNKTDNKEKVEKRLETHTDTLKTSEADLKAFYEALPPEMKKEIDEYGWDIDTILNYVGPDARNRYDMSPFVSICILKVLSDSRHLDMQELLEYVRPGADLGDLSDGVKAALDKYFAGTYVGGKEMERAVQDKFKEHKVPVIEPKKQPEPANKELPQDKKQEEQKQVPGEEQPGEEEGFSL